MDQQRQGTRSTKIRNSMPSDTNVNNTAIEPDHNVKTTMAYMSIQDLPSGRIYTDQTGSFPVAATQGVKAVMILYDYDSNAILVEGITSQAQDELTREYIALFTRLTNCGSKPQIVQRMDNEISHTVRSFLQTQNITLELTPAHVHRRNAAERAIRTWKNHFLAGLASLNPRFPIRFWSHLLPQSELSLNLLRQSRINPRLPAYAKMHGHFDNDKTPLAPPGCEVIAFHSPSQRSSWQYHGY